MADNGKYFEVTFRKHFFQEFKIRLFQKARAFKCFTRDFKKDVRACSG